MNIQLRPASPEDADSAIPLIYSSGPAVFDYIFASRSRDEVLPCVRKAFVEDGGELGYGVHTVAVADGAVAGIGCVFSGDTTLRFMLAGIRYIFGFYGPLRGAGVIRRALQIERIVQPPKGNLHYIAHLGVAPEFRSRGIGAEIVQHLLSEGRKQGRTLAALDVSAENPRAQALYERLGFAVTAERPSTLRNHFAAVPTHYRMELNV